MLNGINVSNGGRLIEILIKVNIFRERTHKMHKGQKTNSEYLENQTKAILDQICAIRIFTPKNI